MSFRADLALYDETGRLAAVVEVKNRSGTSRKWAAQTRRNMLAHGTQGESSFFLLVTPDRFYVWKDAGSKPVETMPMYVANAEQLFAPYFTNAKIDPGHVTGHAFEFLVGAWLSDLTRSGFPASTSAWGWLEESGFRTAALNGRVEYEAAV